MKTKNQDLLTKLRVILDNELRTNPSCNHGPSILFERTNIKTKKSVQFYACSAFRDRKQCNFYVIKGDKNRNGAAKEKNETKNVVNIQDPSAFCDTCQTLLGKEFLC